MKDTIRERLDCQQHYGAKAEDVVFCIPKGNSLTHPYVECVYENTFAIELETRILSFQSMEENRNV